MLCEVWGVLCRVCGVMRDVDALCSEVGGCLCL